MKFYIDTCIWIDLYENRSDFNNKPIGEMALRFFMKLRLEKNPVIVSDILLRELDLLYSIEEVKGMIKPFEDILRVISSTREQLNEARKIALNRKLPKGDVLHAILARDTKSILITRDNHFKNLRDISKFHRPEDFL